MHNVDQRTIWEQSVSLFINELGFSSYPHTKQEECKAAYLQAASCTLLLLSKMRFSSSVIRGLR